MSKYFSLLGKILFVIALIGGPGGASGGAVSVAPVAPVSVVTTGPVALDQNLTIFEDRSRALSIADVTRPPVVQLFRPSSAKLSSMSFTRSAWWGRFVVANTTDKAVAQVVEFGHPVIDRLEFYRWDEAAAEFRRQVAGDSVIGRQVDFRGLSNLFLVDIPAHSEREFYFRMSGDSTISMAVTLHSLTSFVAGVGADMSVRALFFGVLLASVFYSLAIFIVAREKSYLYFAIFIFAVAVYHGETWGYLAAFVWPETTWLSNFITISSLSVLVLSIARFTSQFLKLEENAPRTNRVFQALQVLGGITFLLSLIDYHFASYVLIAGMGLGTVAAVVTSGWLWRSGVDYARLYTICWGFLCTFTILYCVQKLGFIQLEQFIDTLFQVGFTLVAMFFAVVFADRFQRIARLKEIQLQKARDEAIAASRVKSKFLAVMSHELRTPLNAVIGFSDMLAAETLGPLGNQKYREYAKDIKQSGTHLLHIINDLLEVSRVEAEQVELDEQQIMVMELVERCLRIIDERARRSGVTLRSEVGAALPLMLGDEMRIQQVLLNLLQNAVNFTPPGGSVSVAADITAAGEFRLSVTDSGIGIAEEDRERIFEPFVQVASHLTRQHGGAGLGLSIVRSIVALHGGRLVVAGELGQGTTFEILFPKSRVLAG